MADQLASTEVVRNRRQLGACFVLFLCLAGCAWTAAATRPRAADGPKTKIEPRSGLTFVWIEAGTFRMGCSQGDSECTDTEKPAHTVTITKGFWIGQTPVTQAAYSKGQSNPSTFPGDQLPVEQISWVAARGYCEALGMRLPTEAEWEFAARGGGTTARYGAPDAIAWHSANSNNQTHPVAQKQPNGYGLYDMLGDVREWVADWYAPYTPESATDPKGPPNGGPRDGRVLRGSSWLDAATYVRLSSRDRSEPAEHDSTGGFRCAGN
jgi:formylglycine-generating enzyme required for sulfatase activity